MKECGESPIIEKVVVNQGEILLLRGDGITQQSATCDDIAKLALAIHEKEHFFSLRRSIKTRFSRDINGSGVQCLDVAREDGDFSSNYLVQVYFDAAHRDEASFLYEADFIRDQGKDYEPSVNFGKSRFVAKMAWLKIDWGSEEVAQWRSDAHRLSTTPKSLTSWVSADLEMLVRCSSGVFCGQSAVFAKGDLSRFVAAGLSLEGLKDRLACSKCGKRKARLLAL
ncbi:hypothetical protein [Stenotrophomonas maltophilia]